MITLNEPIIAENLRIAILEYSASIQNVTEGKNLTKALRSVAVTSHQFGDNTFYYDVTITLSKRTPDFFFVMFFGTAIRRYFQVATNQRDLKVEFESLAIGSRNVDLGLCVKNVP